MGVNKVGKSTAGPRGPRHYYPRSCRWMRVCEPCPQGGCSHDSHPPSPQPRRGRRPDVGYTNIELPVQKLRYKLLTLIEHSREKPMKPVSLNSPEYTKEAQARQGRGIQYTNSAQTPNPCSLRTGAWQCPCPRSRIPRVFRCESANPALSCMRSGKCNFPFRCVPKFSFERGNRPYGDAASAALWSECRC